MGRKQSQNERRLLYQSSHKLLCPGCERKTPKEMMFEHMGDLPFLVKSKCAVCGYEGMFVEIPISTLPGAH